MVLLASAPAAAQEAPAPAPAAKHEPTAGDLATARGALKDGLTRRSSGDAAGALAPLTSAWDLVPTPVTGFELGKTHLMLGHVLQAHELFKKVVRMPPSLEESSRSQTARDESARLAKEIEPRIPSLRLKVTVPKGATAVVKVDDDVISMTGPETLRAVDPGPHDVVAQAGDGPEQKVHVEIAESEIKDIPLSPQWIPPKPPPPPKGRDIIFVRQTNPIAFIGFSVAGAALIVTTVSTFVYLNATSAAEDKCGRNYCPPIPSASNVLPTSVVDTSYNSDQIRRAVAGTLAIVGAISTVVFAGVGIFGVSRPIKEKVVAGVRPTINGIEGTF
jgi:hypothetical protein